MEGKAKGTEERRVTAKRGKEIIRWAGSGRTPARKRRRGREIWQKKEWMTYRRRKRKVVKRYYYWGEGD